MNLKNIYDWYKLPEEERKLLWTRGEFIQDIDIGPCIPVLWENPYINYGQQYGLLYFPKIFGELYRNLYKNRKFSPWFGVRVFSPDDWDHDLDFMDIDVSNEELVDVQYKDLIRITKEFVMTGPAHPIELFNLIDDEMFRLHGLVSYQRKSK